MKKIIFALSLITTILHAQERPISVEVAFEKVYPNKIAKWHKKAHNKGYEGYWKDKRQFGSLLINDTGFVYSKVETIELDDAPFQLEELTKGHTIKSVIRTVDYIGNCTWYDVKSTKGKYIYNFQFNSIGELETQRTGLKAYVTVPIFALMLITIIAVTSSH